MLSNLDNIGNPGILGTNCKFGNLGSLNIFGNPANRGTLFNLGSLGKLDIFGNIGSLGRVLNLGNFSNPGYLGFLANMQSLQVSQKVFFGTLGNPLKLDNPRRLENLCKFVSPGVLCNLGANGSLGNLGNPGCLGNLDYTKTLRIMGIPAISAISEMLAKSANMADLEFSASLALSKKAQSQIPCQPWQSWQSQKIWQSC